MYVLVQSCLTLCDLMDYSPPGSSVHGILQAGILEWVAMPSSRGSSRPRDPIHVSQVLCLGRPVLYYWAIWETCAPQIFFVPLLFYLLKSLSSKRHKDRGFSTLRWSFSDSKVLNMVENIFKNLKQWWQTRKHPLSLNALKTCFEMCKADMNQFETENLNARLKKLWKKRQICAVIRGGVCEGRRDPGTQGGDRTLQGRDVQVSPPLLRHQAHVLARQPKRPSGRRWSLGPSTGQCPACLGRPRMVGWRAGCQDGAARASEHPFREAGPTGPTRAPPILEESTTENSRVFHVQRWEQNSKLPGKWRASNPS